MSRQYRSGRHWSLLSFRFPQCLSLRSELNTRSTWRFNARMTPIRANIVGRAFDDHTPVMHHRHLLGNAERDVHVVLDHDQRDLAAQSEQQVGEQLADAVHCVTQGKLWISSNVLELYARRSIRALKTVNESPTAQGITQRESQVVELVKRRLSNKEIGAILNIQESTVKFHLSNIFSKLQVNRRSELQDKGQLSDIWRKLIAS